MSEKMSELMPEEVSGKKVLKLNVRGADDYFIKEAFKSLRTNIQFCGSEKKVIFLTSCNENDGKSTVTLNLAKSFAELGKKVLVLDADMRKSVMAGRNTDAANFYGLSEVLTNQRTLEESLLQADNENLHILFAGTYPPNPVELLSGKAFSDLIAELRKTYDYVFIDTPPLGVVVDAAVIATNCDGGILVLSENSRYKQAQRVIDQVNKSGCKFLGVVRNRVLKKAAKYAYYKRK